MNPFELSGASLVLFLDAVLSFGCSACIFIGLWPFKGLFHSWFYTRVPYNWSTHTMMGWFDVGCIGLLCTNVYAFRKFSASTSPEAYEMVYTTNALMHFLWGAHNLHLYLVAVFSDKGTGMEWRRPYVILLWSLFGACGTGFARNIYTLYNGPNEVVTNTTWLLEWACLVGILGDLFYHLIAEHTFGMAMQRDGSKKVK